MQIVSGWYQQAINAHGEQMKAFGYFGSSSFCCTEAENILTSSALEKLTMGFVRGSVELNTV